MNIRETESTKQSDTKAMDSKSDGADKTPQKLTLLELVTKGTKKGFVGYHGIQKVWFSKRLNQWLWMCDRINNIVSDLNNRGIKHAKSDRLESQGLSIRSSGPNFAFLMQDKASAEKNKFIKNADDFFLFYGKKMPGKEEIESLRNARTLSQNDDNRAVSVYIALCQKKRKSFIGATDKDKIIPREQPAGTKRKLGETDFEEIDSETNDTAELENNPPKKKAKISAKKKHKKIQQQASEEKSVANSLENLSELPPLNVLADTAAKLPPLTFHFSLFSLRDNVSFFKHLFFETFKIEPIQGEEGWILDKNEGYKKKYGSLFLAKHNQEKLQRLANSCQYSIQFIQKNEYVLLCLKENNKVSAGPVDSTIAFAHLEEEFQKLYYSKTNNNAAAIPALNV